MHMAVVGRWVCVALMLTTGSALAETKVDGPKNGPKNVAKEPAPAAVADMTKHIEKVLGEKNEVAYLDTQLGDIVNDLELRTRLNIELDVAALTADGKGTETVFTFSTKDASLQSILNQLLSKQGLTWIVADEAVIITTQAGAEARAPTKAYSVATLAAKADSLEFDELSEMIMQAVDPTSWRANGGSAGAIARISAKKSLVVTQTHANHLMIAELLKQVAAPLPFSGEKPQIAGGDDAVARIEAELQRKSDVQYLDTQLSDVVNDLELRHKVKIHLDIPALTDDGKGPETVFNKTLNNMSFASILDLLLVEHGLRWTIADEAILITTENGEAKRPTSVAYSVAELADSEGNIDYEEIVDMLTQSVAPESWREAGGLIGTISRLSSKQAIVVTQSYANQRKIQAILKQLAEK